MFRNIKKNNSGFMLLGSLSIVIFLSIVLSAAMFSSEMQLKEDTQRNSIQEAFYAAEAGLDMAIFELRKNSEWRPGEDEQPQVQDVRLNRTLDDDETTVGFYSVVVKDGGVFNGWETVWIQSIGRDALNDLTRVVVARAIIDSHARFLVSTLGNLRIESRASINADILGTDVYFEVNPSLEPPENAIYVTGGVFYIRDIYGEDNPNVFGEDDGAITSYKIPSITFAGVNLNRYREIAVELEASGKGIYHGGDLTVDLNTLGGLNAAPIIIFAEGDITIFGEYNFSPLVVSSGNIFISGNIEPDESLPVRPQIGVFAKKDIIITEDSVSQGGDLSIEAFLIADGGGDSKGVIVSEGQGFGTLNFTGAIAARGEGDTAINLNSFATRNYIFNPALNSDRTIPFLPFIANIIEWRESTINDTFPPEEPMN